MMKSVQWAAIFWFAIRICATAFGQTAPAKKNLVVNGRTAPGAVIQIDDHSYVEVSTFAQLTGATVQFEANRVVLTMPSVKADSVSKETPNNETPNQQALSKGFARAAVIFVAEGREWKTAIASAVRTGGTVGPWIGPWLQEYRSRTEQALNQASIAASTKADQQAFGLLHSAFANLRDWDTQTEAEIQNLNGEKTVNPQALQNDPLLGKISDCGSFLSAMLMSGQFEDHTSCH